LILRLAAGGLLLFFGLTQSRESAFPYLLGLSLANLAAATLVAASLGPSTARSLQWIGKISYSLYLWHQPVGLALSHLMASASLIGIGTKTVVSVAAACGSYYGIEKPCLALKNRLPP
jgi:peptidoglycan/LPS O-acetylase OafA/YrhL